MNEIKKGMEDFFGLGKFCYTVFQVDLKAFLRLHFHRNG